MSEVTASVSNSSRASMRGWRSAPALASVHALNLRIVKALVKLARSERAEIPLRSMERWRGNWRRLDDMAMQAIAQVPVLLVDARFQQLSWWQWALRGGTGLYRGGEAIEWLARKQSSELLRESLMLAWATARDDRNAARLLFGMSREVAALMADLTPHHIETLAGRHGRELRLRWDDVPTFWSAVMRAVSAGSPDEMQNVSLYAISLLGGELTCAKS